MSKHEVIVPEKMRLLVERAGYAPAVRAGKMLFCAGQVGRTTDLEVIEDPELQFEACWGNLEEVLAAGGCTLQDVVDITTYHVRMNEHMEVFRTVKNRMFPRVSCAWTRIGVVDLAHPGLLVEIKAIALIPQRG